MIEILKSTSILDAQFMVVLSVEREFHYRLQNGSQLKLSREKQQNMALGLRQPSV